MNEICQLLINVYSLSDYTAARNPVAQLFVNFTEMLVYNNRSFKEAIKNSDYELA